MNELQLANRQHHSKEAALLKVSNDILRAVEQYQDVLVMVGLSAVACVEGIVSPPFPPPSPSLESPSPLPFESQQHSI